MSDFMDDVLGFDPPKAPALPPVLPPIPIPNAGDLATFKRQKKGSGARGQAGTILAQGELIPMDIGKRQLLG